MWKYKIIMDLGDHTEILMYTQDQINALNELMAECVRKGIKFRVTAAS